MIEELEQMDNLKNELSHLKSLLNVCNVKKEYSRIAKEYTQEAHKQQIFEFIKNGFQDINKELKELDEIITQIESGHSSKH